MVMVVAVGGHRGYRGPYVYTAVGNGGITVALLYRWCRGGRGRDDRTTDVCGSCGGGGGCGRGRFDAGLGVRTAIAARPVVDSSTSSSATASSSHDDRRLMCREHRSTGCCRQELVVLLHVLVLLHMMLLMLLLLL